jgi:hypothetical protein
MLVTAEDGKIFQHEINKAIEELHSWFYTNNLRINAEKTIAISFHARHKKAPLKPQIKFDSLDIAYKSETKFLGIHISESKKWDAHTKSLSSKLSKICYMIRSLKGVTSSHIIRNIYFAYFHAHLRYGVIFWGGGTESENIFKLLKQVIQIIIGLGRHTSCRQLFIDLGILPIACLYILEILCCIKVYAEKFHKNAEIHSHSTCQKLNLHVQFCRTDVFKNGVVNAGIKLYNRLPNQIGKLEKIQQFKRMLRSFLLHHVFYSVAEYMSY